MIWLTGARISSGQASLKPPLNERVMGLRTAERMTTSLGDLLRKARAPLAMDAIS